MKFRLLFILTIISALFTTSCSNEEPKTPEVVDNVLFMYFPWSTSLTHNFRQNIEDMEIAYMNANLQGQKIVVFFAESERKAELFEIKLDKGHIIHETIKFYPDINTTTEEGIATVLNDMKTNYVAKEYSMVIGAHGMGWLPVSKTRSLSLKYYWDYDSEYPTRFFGGLDADSQTDISTFANAIRRANLKMEYIYYDVCYMANIETAYELKDAANYIIASTSEIMSYGAPYAEIGQYMFGTPDYNAICDSFLKFYSDFSMPYGTLAVIDCSQIDRLATTMNEINTKFKFNPDQVGTIQRLDGYTPTIFFDMGSYVSKLCTDKALLDKFNEDLDKVIIKKVNTPQIYSMSMGRITIDTFSGITISDPSINASTQTITETKWYKATHK